MATGSTAPSIVMTTHSHSHLDQASTVSSPLSSPQAEGHDAEAEDLDMKSTPSDDGHLDKPNNPRADSPDNATHDESDLSELETNDSEAETERLYDTPRKINTLSGNAASIADEDKEHNRTIHISPSKLQDHLRGGAEPDSGEEDNDEPAQSSRIQSDDSSVARKRKRSPPVLLDHADGNEPPRKRSGSILDANDNTSSISKPTESSGEKSAEPSGEDDDSEEPVAKAADDVVKVAPRSKSKRSHKKKQKEPDDKPLEAARETEGNAPDEEKSVDDEPVPSAEVDEEARHEEECKGETVACDSIVANYPATVERKRQAFEQFASIEKQFAILREKLYEERLKELEEEEASLTSDTPTHPEYIAMMECIDKRRDDSLKRSAVEFQFEIDAANRWAVARRAQIFSQFHQSVRESREKTMDELGKQWYEIQHERRKNANPIPDYGFRFPKDKAQQKKQAIARNKETSILAGIAQHHGFPAAPEVKPASESEIEDDFQAMRVSLRPVGGG